MKTKILIVDDDPNVCVSLSSILEFKGYDVDSASSGESALKKLKTFAPNLVLLDTCLPDIDGVKLCKKIKKANSKNIPKVVIYTGYVDAVDASRAIAAGADDYTVKTGDFSALLELLEKLLELS